MTPSKKNVGILCDVAPQSYYEFQYYYRYIILKLIPTEQVCGDEPWISSVFHDSHTVFISNRS